ncbi:MAG: hypothetical protein A3F40_02685 [Chlamydiae bacterium RIFCSPHIGHO2_12_FULL_27_8]|nr:MAG: hypothetical protein A3F40_02685 [Chlamydiae bacterium RIFCSPHIGHO2_12_FULL_27_8]OGN66303.1 MAG: hypothetical protein A2888_00455 [Chlamydiae bacterium RIFCSPLOWO2_01_FULL_28_7]
MPTRQKVLFLLIFLFSSSQSIFAVNSFSIKSLKGFDFNSVDNEINNFYKITLQDQKGNQAILLIGSNSYDEKYIFDVYKKDKKKWTVISVEHLNNKNEFLIDKKYKDFIYATITNENNEKRVFLLCEKALINTFSKKIGKKKHEEKTEEAKPEKIEKTAEEKAYEKLDEALTDAGIGIVELGMGTLGIIEGHIAGGTAGCIAGGYELKKSYDNFKEAKELFEAAREEKKEKEEEENINE